MEILKLVMKEFRDNCIKVLKSYGGKLIEVKYTKGVSSSAFIDQLNAITITPDIRRATLKRLINTKRSPGLLVSQPNLSYHS